MLKTLSNPHQWFKPILTFLTEHIQPVTSYARKECHLIGILYQTLPRPFIVAKHKAHIFGVKPNPTTVDLYRSFHLFQDTQEERLLSLAREAESQSQGSRLGDLVYSYCEKVAGTMRWFLNTSGGGQSSGWLQIAINLRKLNGDKNGLFTRSGDKPRWISRPAHCFRCWSLIKSTIRYANSVRFINLAGIINIGR